MPKFMKKINIGVLTFPLGKSGNFALSNLIDVIYPIYNNIYLITGNNGYHFFKNDKRLKIYGISHESRDNIILRIAGYVYAQLMISHALACFGRLVDTWIFFIGGEGLILPMLIARLLRIKVILVLAGFPIKEIETQKDPLLKVASYLSKINFILSSKIVVYSKSIIEERDMAKYKAKICIAHKHFLDFSKFKIENQIQSRDYKIGFIGSLHPIKGVQNFVQAIPLLIENKKRLKFVIIGDGILGKELKFLIKEYELNNLVEFIGWVPHEDVPKYLNELKMIVLPSFTEGLPNIMLEAMACGTPVLATSVGSIIDVIIDGENGFIMQNNSPMCIAANIERVLDTPDIDRIVTNARAFVENDFSFENAVEMYRKLLTCD